MSLPRMLFHRDFIEYTGGHGKVWNYFLHALELGWDARVFMTARSLRDERNPWMRHVERIEVEWRPEQADLLFIGGVDWAALADPHSPPRPVINLVQHVRHAEEGHPLREYLRAPAHRICVSQPVADAINATGEVNGPVTVIPAALDLPHRLGSNPMVRDGVHVVIAAIKAPELAFKTAAILRGHGVVVEVLDQWLPRNEYLQRIASAAVAVALPHAREGFYLPALEAMALGVPLVTNDCVGSREYARDGWNCLIVAPDAEFLAAAVMQALQVKTAEQLSAHGRQTATDYGQLDERHRFAAVVQSVAEQRH